MTESVTERFERRERNHHEMMAFLRTGPREPLVTSGQVLEIACSSPSCGALAGQPCDTRTPHFSIAALALKGMGGVHLRRYLDRSHDPR